MSTIIKRKDRKGFDQVLRYAVTLAWDDLMTPVEPRLVRVEYRHELGHPVKTLGIWSVKAGGYQDLVCYYPTQKGPADPCTARLGGQEHPERLGRALDLVMKDQDGFTPGTNRNGLVQVYRPSSAERAEAAAWIRAAQGPENNAEFAELRKTADADRQDQEAWSRMEDEGPPIGRTAVLPDATGHSG